MRNNRIAPSASLPTRQTGGKRPSVDLGAVHFGAAPGKLTQAYQKLSYHFFKRVLVPIFRPIIETFIWEMLALDVAALWLPRIYNSLTRGAFDYDPKKDPKTYGKSRWEVLKMTAQERWNRLNWVNALEETGREIASGPAIFMWPTLVFTIGRRLGDKTGIELGNGHLTKMTDTFAEQIKQHGLGHTEADQKAALKRFTLSLFGDETMKKTPIEGQNITYGNKLEQWVDKWIGEIYTGRDLKFHQFKEKFAHYKALVSLEKELGEEIIQHYNAHHMAQTRFNQYGKTPIHWLSKEGGKLAPETAEAGKELLVSYQEFFARMNRWKDFAFNVFKERTKYADAPLADLFEGLRRRLTFRKATASLLSTIATMVFLFKLVRWTQVHDRYPANRLVEKDALKHPSVATSMPEHPSQAVAAPVPPTPVQALTNNGVVMNPFQPPLIPTLQAGGYMV